VADQNDSGIQFSKAELLRRIYAGYSQLEETLQAITPEEMGRAGPEGWAIKDHMIHLAVWERGIAELLTRQDRYAGMGIPNPTEKGLDEDAINDLIYRQHADRSALEAREVLNEAHTQLLQAVEALSDAELQQPYSVFLPADQQPGPQNPVWHWIVGNTYGHYELHLGYIQSLLDEQRG
jgi:hypothetical protein